MPASDAMADHAANYARAGLLIFPVRPDKTPYVSQKQAISDADQVATWWRQYPDALIGCRVPEDVVILDIDPRHGGHDTWRALQEAHEARPPTRIHQSGRGDGGGHIWFKRPWGPGEVPPYFYWPLSIGGLDRWAEANGVGHRVGQRWASGIDLLQHDHRYTILPPSPHPETGQPYTWSFGGPDQTIADMPAWLAGLLTQVKNDADPLPTTDVSKGILTSGSIADWFTDQSTWPQLLEPNGWTLVSGNGSDDGTLWRHPTATGKYSASIKHGCLFVHSPNTPLEPTAPGDPHGYTRFRAWATLAHGGDLSSAARAAREARDGPLPDSVDLPALIGSTAADGVLLPDEFWTARSVLHHVRRAAWSRQRSPDAVLHVVLARIAAAIPHTIKLPAIVGSISPLCYFANLLAPSGSGKSNASDIGTELLRVGDHVVDGLPGGSGEGLVEVLFDFVTEKDEDNKKREVKRQVKFNAYVYIDEGDVLASLSSRSGNTTAATLRTIWSGKALGAANASKERKRIVPAGQYTYGATVGYQTARTGALLEDDSVAAGTPQRFAWALAVDPTIPDEPPDWPGMLDWRPPDAGQLGRNVNKDAGYVRHILSVDDAVQREIRAADLLRARGQAVDDPLQSQADLLRLRMAALLTLLDGRLDISYDDWALAGTMKRTSDTVVRHALKVTGDQRKQIEREMSTRLAYRAVDATVAKEKRHIVECAERIASKVRQTGTMGVADIRRQLTKNQRDVFEAGLDHAKLENWVVEESAPGQGTPKRLLKVVT